MATDALCDLPTASRAVTASWRRTLFSLENVRNRRILCVDFAEFWTIICLDNFNSVALFLGKVVVIACIPDDCPVVAAGARCAVPVRHPCAEERSRGLGARFPGGGGQGVCRAGRSDEQG